MLVKDQWEVYINWLETRKRNPAKGSTISAYRSYARTYILPELGKMELSKLENGAMKKFVAKLAEKNLSPATIAAVTNCVKGIVASAMDDNGNELFPRKWNSSFIDAPPVENQKAPIIQSKALQEALERLREPYRTLIVTLAATGLRIGECLSLRVGVSEGSYWDYQESKLVIRRGLWRGREQSTKTPAGQREVDIPNDMIEYLRSQFPVDTRQFMFPVRLSTAYNKIREAGIEGFHVCRRFRCTHLENVGVPRGMAMFWTGHAAKDVHETYLKLDKDIQARKDWAFKAGLNFTIPKANRSEDPTQTSKPLDEPKARGRSEEVSCQRIPPNCRD